VAAIEKPGLPRLFLEWGLSWQITRRALIAVISDRTTPRPSVRSTHDDDVEDRYWRDRSGTAGLTLTV